MLPASSALTPLPWETVSDMLRDVAVRYAEREAVVDELADRIRARAVADRRSMTQEIIYLLEQALAGPTDSLETRWRREGALQVEAWSHLAGQWQSERATSEDTEAPHHPRSGAQDTGL